MATAKKAEVEEAKDAPEASAAPVSLMHRILAVMDELGKIEKTGKMTFGQSYNFTEYGVVVASLRPLFIKHGVVFLPEITGTNFRGEGKSTYVSCAMRFTLYNADDPSDMLEAAWAGEAGDTGDKSVSKAGTSGTKYWLMKMFLVSDKDDPDGEDPTPRPETRRQETPPYKGNGAAPVAQQSVKASAPTVLDLIRNNLSRMGREKELDSLPPMSDDQAAKLLAQVRAEHEVFRAQAAKAAP